MKNVKNVIKDIIYNKENVKKYYAIKIVIYVLQLQKMKISKIVFLVKKIFFYMKKEIVLIIVQMDIIKIKIIQFVQDVILIVKNVQKEKKLMKKKQIKIVSHVSQNGNI